MPNCPLTPVKKIKCKSSQICKGSYSRLDRDLVTGPLKKQSSLLYSGQPYECPPVTTCMVAGVNQLPNIPKEQYSIYNSTLSGIEPTNLMSNNFNKQCGAK